MGRLSWPSWEGDGVWNVGQDLSSRLSGFCCWIGLLGAWAEERWDVVNLEADT